LRALCARAAALQTDTQLIDAFSVEFAKLYANWCAVVKACPFSFVHQRYPVVAAGPTLPSVAEGVLRSAAVVEQTYGGLTANLWDDPFEWTLPETLTTQASLLMYLDEVEETRKRAFRSFLNDSDLLKGVSTPSGKVKNIASLLLETLSRAQHFQGQAALTAELLSAQNTSGFIT
jgi:hypothetical protein